MSDKLYASDDECREMRGLLIEAGRVVPKSADAAKSGSAPSLDIEMFQVRKTINVADIPEEGTYTVRPIKSDAEYERRKRNYLVMLQSILRAREELKLEFEDQSPRKRRK